MDSSEEQGSPGGKAEEVEESPTGFDEYVEVEDEKPPSNGSLRQKKCARTWNSGGNFAD